MLVGGSLLRGAIKVYNLTISANTNNYNLNTALTSAGWNGTAPANVNVVIQSGVTVGSSSTSASAFVVEALPVGSKVVVTNDGTISGAGGAGGSANSSSASAGGAGGVAIQTSFALTIANNGTIAGGGGGGGGSIYDSGGKSGATIMSLGGGGGAGTTYGIGGSGNINGSNGNATTGGAGGAFFYSSGPNGGNLGVAGETSSTYHINAAGGIAGNYVVGSSYVTWAVTGTRLGGSS